MKKFLKNTLLILITITLVFALSSCSSTREKQKQELAIAKANFAVQNYPLAFQRLLPLAEQGNAEAQYAIGYMYYYGLGVERNEKTALEWIKKAAKQEDKQAVTALAVLRTAENSAFSTPVEEKKN